MFLLAGAVDGWAAPLDDARRLMSEGKAAEAHQAVSAYLETHPGDREGRFLLANILAQEGRLDAAYDVFQELVAEAPDDAVGTAVRRLFRQRGATAADAARVARLFAEAQRAVAAKRWDAAIVALDQAVRLAPDNLAGRNNLAKLLQQVGRFPEAAEQLEALVRLRPDDLDLVKSLALLYDRLGRSSEASQYYEQILRSRPQDPESLFGMGRRALFFLQDGEAASGFFERLLKVQPENATAAFLLGVSRTALKDTAGAQPAFERAVAIDPTHYKAQFELGKLYEEAGRDAEALAAFQQVVRYGGSSPEAEQSRRRLSLFGTSPEVARKARATLDRGLEALGEGRLDPAEKAFQEVLSLVPDNTLALYNLATVYTREGRNEEAIDALKRAVASDETHFLSHYGLALIYAGAGRFEEAFEAYKQVLKWAPPDTSYHAEAQAKVAAVQKILAAYETKQGARRAFLAGNELAGQGDSKGALEQFQKAIELDPENPFYHYNAGIMYGDTNQFDKAFLEFREAVRLKPDHVQSHFRLALFYQASGLPQQAAKSFRNVIRYGTTEPEVAEAKKRLEDVLQAADRKEKAAGYLVVGNALHVMGESEKALEAMRRAKERVPQNVGILRRLTELLLEAGRTEEALDVVNEGRKVAPNDYELLFYYGQIQGEMGDVEAGVESLRKSAESVPNRLEGWVVLAKALGRLGRTDEAIAALRTFVEANPDNYRAVIELGTLLRQADRPAEAAALYDWYLASHTETAELLLLRGLVAVMLGAGGEQAAPPADTALAGLVTGTEGIAGTPRYQTPNEWFERVIAIAGPKDDRFVKVARTQIAQTQRLRMNIAQTVIDYNTNANNSATSPKTGVSSQMTFSVSYLVYRGFYFTLPVSFSTTHNLHYTLQTYVNTNTVRARMPTNLPHARLTPDVSASQVRTQRGRSSQRYAVGASLEGQFSVPSITTADYTRTEFTSFTNPLNNYLEGRLDLRVGHGFPIGKGFRVSGDLSYLNRVRDVVAARLDTDRTDLTASLGLGRSFARQRSVATSLFYTNSQDVRASNLRPGTSEIVPIQSHVVGGSASANFRPYPKVTGTLSGSYSLTTFTSGIFQAFPDPGGGDPIVRETGQKSTSLSFGLQFSYRPAEGIVWRFNIQQVQARASVDVPADVEDILTNQVVQDNINKRRTFTLTMNYAF